MEEYFSKKDNFTNRKFTNNVKSNLYFPENHHERTFDQQTDLLLFHNKNRSKKLDFCSLKPSFADKFANLSSFGQDNTFLPKINQLFARTINSPKKKGFNYIIKDSKPIDSTRNKRDKTFSDHSNSPTKNYFYKTKEDQTLSVMKKTFNVSADKKNVTKLIFAPNIYFTNHKTPNDLRSIVAENQNKNNLNLSIFDILKLNLKIKKKSFDEKVIDPEKLIKEFFIMEEPNFRFKERMEDFTKIIEKNENQSLFCLFDGHGGEYVAKFAKERFPEIFFNNLNVFKSDIHAAFQESFACLDSELNQTKALSIGSTATVIYIFRENGKKYLYSANLGDSRSLLISKQRFLRLSYDHKSSDHLEAERMKSHGGFILNGRLLGTLNLSRSLGDLAMKKSGLINVPFIYKTELTQEDLMVVIASDGVWDVIRDLDAFNISKSCKDSKQMCEYLVKESMSLGSRDNISCISIFL